MANTAGLLVILIIACVLCVTRGQTQDVSQTNGTKKTSVPSPTPTIAGKAPSPPPKDKYRISPKFLSGNTETLNWFLTDRQIKDNKKTLDNMFDHASHGEHTNNKESGQLASVNGYKGMIIDHYVNGKLLHTYRAAKCDGNEYFQWDIIRNHPNNKVISDEKLGTAFNALLKCLKSKTSGGHAHGGHKH